MKTALFLIMSLLVVSCAGSMPAPVSAKRINVYYESAVIVLVKTGEDGTATARGWSGTGFAISNDKDGNTGTTLLTNKHICQASSNATYTITDYSGGKYEAKFVRYAPYADLCLIHTDAVLRPVKLASEDATQFSHIVVIGAPHGMFPNVTEGYIGGYYNVDLGGDTYTIHVRAQATSVPIYPGNSGSPVWNDDGKVVGIMFAGHGSAEHITMLIPVNEILSFLDTKHNLYER